MRYKITKTLLNSWMYTFNCAEGYEDEAWADFLSTLNREESKPNEAMQNGLDFEDDVYRAARCDANILHPKWERGIEQVASIIRGAQIQVPAGQNLELDGRTYWVHGIIDALKAGVIYDVKFLNKSMGSVDIAGKYLNDAQHPVYFYSLPEAREFRYLVSDGDSLYVETYRPKDTPHVSEIIQPFIESITENGLLDTYLEKWAID